MTFNTRNGSRGAWQPRGGRLSRWMNKVVVNRQRRKGGGKAMGMDTLILTTVGAKTGAERTNLVGRFPGEDDSWLIVASAGGGPRNPAWYYNLAAHPDRVTIEVTGRAVDVTAEQLHGAERDEAWRQITTAAPRFAGYQEKTDRELPVIRLTARAG